MKNDELEGQSPVRGGTLRWGGRFSDRAAPPSLRAPPSSQTSPVRGGTLRWSARNPPGVAAPGAEPPPPPSPVRAGTLRWGELRAAVEQAAQSGPPAPERDAPPASMTRPIDRLDDVPMEELLASLLSSALVPREKAAREERRAPQRKSEPQIAYRSLPADLASAIYDALDGEDAESDEDPQSRDSPAPRC